MKLNEIRPNERIFKEEEKKKYKLKFFRKLPEYEFEPNENIVTLNDKIDYILNIDGNKIKKNSNFKLIFIILKTDKRLIKEEYHFVKK